MSASVEAMTGVSAAALVGRTPREAGAPASLCDALELVARAAVASGEPQASILPGERTLRCRVFPERGAGGAVVAVSVLVEDVTERARTEAALRASEQRFRALADAIPQIVCVLRPDGAPEYVNARWAEFSGKTVEESARLGWQGLLHPDDLPTARTCRRRVIETRAPQEVEVRYRGADGAYRWFLSRLAPIAEEGGQVVRFVGAAVDIDARKRAATEREQLLEEAQEGDRRKSEFLALLSHELRNPLAAIRNGVYLLDRVPPASDEAARARAVIARQSGQLTRLVDDLLDVTRIARGKVELHRERLDAREVVRRTCEDHQPVFEESGVALRVDLPAAPAWIDADPTRVAQVVGNLVQNAAKFTPPGGVVTVAVEADADGAIFRVHDDGVGMDPHQVVRMFEPFVQAEANLARAQGGLGLGLALVKGLVELHGGTVTARSDGVGRGSEFVVRLPRGVAAGPAAAAEAAPPPSGRTILVVEDNVDAGDTLADVLLLGGHRPHVARDGRTGIAMARELKPDVVLCDIGLPDVDGYEVARALRADGALRGTRLVALSGYAQPEDRDRARAAGFDAHLAKPPALEALLAQLGPRR